MSDYGDQLAKYEIIEECKEEILKLFNEAIDVDDTIWHTKEGTLFDAIMMKLEEIL